MKIQTREVTFTIHIDFEDSDVDMALVEHFAAHGNTAIHPGLTKGAQIKIDKKKLPKTPIGGTVNFALEWLAGYVDRPSFRELLFSDQRVNMDVAIQFLYNQKTKLK